jgi:hypothetical protein
VRAVGIERRLVAGIGLQETPHGAIALKGLQFGGKLLQIAGDGGQFLLERTEIQLDETGKCDPPFLMRHS